MERRNFIKNITTALSALVFYPSIAQSQNGSFIHARALKESDTVGLITPGSPYLDPDTLARIKPTLSKFGLNARIGKYVGKRFTSLRDSIDSRLEDLNNMFADPDIKAVIATGGYGASQILNKIDYDLIRENPKIFIGFSDVTGLHLAIHKQTGLITFHGPTAFSTFNEFTAEHFKKALFSTEPLGELKNPDESDKITLQYPLRTVFPGKASGRLTGGNLSLIAATMGTPYEIETENRILFLEDVSEDSYRVDRMLTQLQLAGKLDKVKGVIWGRCRKCDDSLATGVFTLGEVIDNILAPLKVPVISGMMIGHTANKLTLPLGVQATLDADAQTLTITEAALV